MADDIKHGKLSQITRGSTVTDLVRVGDCASEDDSLFHRPISRVRRTNPSGFVYKAISQKNNHNCQRGIPLFRWPCCKIRLPLVCWYLHTIFPSQASLLKIYALHADWL